MQAYLGGLRAEAFGICYPLDLFVMYLSSLSVKLDRGNREWELKGPIFVFQNRIKPADNEVKGSLEEIICYGILKM